MADGPIQDLLQKAMEDHRAGRLAEAEAGYRRVLASRPDDPDALHMMGVLAEQMGKHAMAIELIRRALKLLPDRADFHNNLGAALRATGDLEGAGREYAAALQLQPDYPDAQQNMADALADLVDPLLNQGNLTDALQAGRQAVQVWPGSPRAHHALGMALHAGRNLDDAIAALREAIRLDPRMAESYNNLGNALRDAGRLDAAQPCYRRAMELRDEPVPHSNLICSMMFDDRAEPGALRQELRRFSDRHAQPLGGRIVPFTGDRDPDRRLSIGYVSPNLRDHIIGRNMLPLLRHHDRERYSITCYSDAISFDAVSEELRRYSDRWHAVRGESDEALAVRIRNDRIDILVDLALHLKGNRLLVFAQKPAPVQITFAGYPGSTGLSQIDYRLTDPYLDPPGADESAYSEKTIRLAHSFWCYEPMAGSPAVNPLPADSTGHITFGCLSDTAKISPTSLRLWSEVLKRAEGSEMVLLAPAGSCRQAMIQALGVAPSRVQFVDRRPRLEYLRTYHSIDLGLDSYPYGGHNTSLDSIWMGVPVVSLFGDAAVSRAVLSQASNLGLTDLVTNDPGAFVEIALSLARNPARLRELRSSLRQWLVESPLMDGRRFARDVEAAYRQAWREAAGSPAIG